MKKETMRGLLILETILLVFLLVRTIFIWELAYSLTLLESETSPDGAYTLFIEQKGQRFLFEPDELRISLSTNDHSVMGTAFTAEAGNNGASAGYEIEWLDIGAKITLKGCEQPDAVYILPFPKDER